MKKQDVIKAWRDGEFFADLTADQRNAMPDSPAAMVAIEDDALKSITGGCSIPEPNCPTSAICTPCPPRHCF